MNVLVACEFSGVVRRAFAARGHNVWSCDFLPSEDGDPQHLCEDVMAVLASPRRFTNVHVFDLMVAHPPCTFLASSGNRWRGTSPERVSNTTAAVEFVRALLAAPVDRICIENPVGILSSEIRKPDQVIQPWMFGHDASKATCLWLKGLPRLRPTNVLDGGRGIRSANQYVDGSHRAPVPKSLRWAYKSVTFDGVADAMACQWG